MYYREKNMPGNSRQMINTFLGYNHRSRIENGEFYDMKNLSSDAYPALTPRKERNCILTLESSDWREVATAITSTYEAQVSEATVSYKSEQIEMEEKETISVSFQIDATLVENVCCTVTYYNGGSVVAADTRNVSGEVSETFVLPETTESFEVEIKADAVDVANFTEEDVSNAVADIVLKQYNWNIRGMLLKNGKLAYMTGSKMYYDGSIYDFSKYIEAEEDYRTEQQLLSFGAYILIFPLGLYLNTNDVSDYGYLGAEYLAGSNEKKVKFILSDANGETVTAATEKPDKPENGQYWLDTAEKKNGLYRWSESMDMWVSVSSTYIRIEMTYTSVPEQPFPEMFQVGDTVFMNSGIEGIDEGSIIVKQGTVKNDTGQITGGYIVVKGILGSMVEKSVSAKEPMYFRRKIPKLSYVCVSNNRVWGCYSGKIEDSDVVNEIYASKLGDAKNWYCFNGASTDSYTLSLGDDGEFTGAFTYQGYPMFFKENVIYKLYGAYPAAYQLYTYNCRGVQKGSQRSLAVVNEYLMYKSVQDVCVFDGSTPTGISGDLGLTRYYKAAAGANGGKYYVSMENEAGEAAFFVYDMNIGIWHKEDDLRLEEFSYNNSGELYGRNRLSVYGFGNAENEFGQKTENEEETIRWMAQTGPIGLEYVGKKYVKRLHICVEMPISSAMEVLISCDGKKWMRQVTLRGTDGLATHSIPVVAERNDSFRLRLEGYGACEIYSLAWDTEEGSDKRCR